MKVPKSFGKTLHKKEANLQAAVNETIFRLGENPRHPSLKTHHVQGTKNPKVFEAYVDMKNRVTWCWGDGDEIILINNCNHDILKFA